jgi:hypothetical protein
MASSSESAETPRSLRNFVAPQQSGDLALAHQGSND